MDHNIVLEYALYISLFLVGTSVLQIISNKTSFPYTVMLLIIGFICQFFNHYFHLNIHFSLSPDVIYFFLLPVLLFEAAIHINIHQFRLQFKTITFLATFGLLLSIFIVGYGLALLLHLPFEVALLFGAIISATDPIAVLALFKTLGAPKRLALVAEGESMFNDATGVIAFRLVSGFAVAEGTFGSNAIINSTASFLFVFIGSILMGGLLGYLCALSIRKLRNDRILITALMTALAIGSFAIAEHFFHLSGVITTVIAGLTVGNIALGRMREKTMSFLNEYFGYIGFFALSLVFFFASFSLNIALFANMLPMLAITILVVMLARAFSVYITAFISNRLKPFEDEPDIPLNWQHILVWGGLRGVIPLVLVYSLPDHYQYKELLLSLTFGTLLFTLFVNGLTIKTLLLKLKLHLPNTEEALIKNQLTLLTLENTEKKLNILSEKEFSSEIIADIKNDLAQKKKKYHDELLSKSTSKAFELSLRLQALQIERETVRKLYEEGRFAERVLYLFESELDLQQDAIDFPDDTKVRAINQQGEIDVKTSYRKKLLLARNFIANFNLLSKILHISADDVILERYTLLRARLFSSYAVIDYLNHLGLYFKNEKSSLSIIAMIKKTQMMYIKRNKVEMESIAKKHPSIVKRYQKKIINQLLTSSIEKKIPEL